MSELFNDLDPCFPDYDLIKNKSHSALFIYPNKKEVVGNPFDRFMETLPKELIVGENYRMKAAWKAYGSPSDYKTALWEGLIQPIDENTYKFLFFTTCQSACRCTNGQLTLCTT